jgi:3-hydroxyisobutyrate dehydrogenase
MGARLIRAHSLVVWNRTRVRASEFTAACKARAMDTPREAASRSEVVITCLPTSAEVEGLLDGPDGLLAGLAPGSLMLDCTSGDPATSRRNAARLAERPVDFADAPVRGGVNGAE